MKIYVPNSAGLLNIEAFIRPMDTAQDGRFDVSFHEKWVAVHPMVLAAVACAGAMARASGLTVSCPVPSIASLPYLVVMGLFDALGVESGVDITQHEPAGRYIPLTQIRNASELDAFMVQVTPLLHGQPDQTETVRYVKYVMSELVRNALEHAVSPVGAFACAQYYSSTKRVSLGVADSGIGVFGSMSRNHPTRSSLAAIELALQPGITGTTARFGGTEYNAGAGLFFTKAIAQTSRNFFVIYSGDALFKLLKTGDQPALLRADASLDRATRRKQLPSWTGTVTGIDLSLGGGPTFAELMADIRQVYHQSVDQTKQAKYKHPRFA